MILPRFYFRDDFVSYYDLLPKEPENRKFIAKGTIVYEAHARDRMNSFYVVSGVAKLSVINEIGTEHIVAFLGDKTIYPINCIEEPFSLNDYMYMTAITNMELIRFPSNLLVDLALNRPKLIEDLLRYYCRYTNLLLSKNVLQTYNDSFQMTCSFLYLYSFYKPAQTDVVDLTQEYIGKTVGITRVQTARILGQLRDEGIIETGRNSLRILDKARLREYCAPIVDDK